jgi:NAD(P)-dependent dehydrogenase (short-subunit alcohol dehydrogenase family)
MLLKDRVALITGAASGIGRAAAVLFAREGARVVLADVSQSGGDQAVEQIRQEGGEARFVRTDVGRMDQVRAMVDAARTAYGRLDIIHSNAGIYGKRGSALDISEEDWDRTLAVNLKATWMIAHCAIPGMLAQGSGVIIVTASVQGLRGYPGYAAYQTSKGGLLALSRSLAADFSPTIRVNALLPGPVVTGLWDDVPESVRQLSAQSSPMQRNATLEEIAQAALFLASDMSSYMTGAELLVDGGLISIIRRYRSAEPEKSS